MVHPDAASATSGSSDGVELVKAFISQDVARQSVLELALKTCLERLHEKKVQADAVEKAHGVKHAWTGLDEKSLTIKVDYKFFKPTGLDSGRWS